jgi:hypothetical protein
MKCGANKEAGLEVRAGKAEGVCVHYHQNAGTNCNIVLSSKSFEMWQGSDIRARQQQIKNAFTKKLKTC